MAPDKYATTSSQSTSLSEGNWKELFIVQNQFNVQDLGFSLKSDKGGSCNKIDTDSTTFSQKTSLCVQYYDGNEKNSLPKGMVWQASFQSATGISCEAITEHKLRNKFIYE